MFFWSVCFQFTAALKFFRACIGLHDEFYNRQIIQNKLMGPILDVVYETMPRNNMLNSVCLEMFEYIKKVGFEKIERRAFWMLYLFSFFFFFALLDCPFWLLRLASFN